MAPPQGLPFERRREGFAGEGDTRPNPPAKGPLFGVPLRCCLPRVDWRTLGEWRRAPACRCSRGFCWLHFASFLARSCRRWQADPGYRLESFDSKIEGLLITERAQADVRPCHPAREPHRPKRLSSQGGVRCGLLESLAICGAGRDRERDRRQVERALPPIESLPEILQGQAWIELQRDVLRCPSDRFSVRTERLFDATQVPEGSERNTAQRCFEHLPVVRSEKRIELRPKRDLSES